LKTLKQFLNEGGEIQKSKQDLLRYTRAVDLLIRVLQVPFKTPPGFEGVPGFNPNGLSMEDIKNFPRFKLVCWHTYDILQDVRALFFLPSPSLVSAYASNINLPSSTLKDPQVKKMRFTWRDTSLFSKPK